MIASLPRACAAAWMLAAGSVVVAAGCGTAESVSTPNTDAGCPPVLEQGDGAIPTPPDGPSLCSGGTCNYQTQSGCDAADACRPTVASDGSVTPGCVPAGPHGGGDACDQSMDNCGRGYICVDERCRKLCCGGDWSVCDAGESCIRQLTISVRGSIVPAGVDLCFPVNDCDVFDLDSCSDQADRICRIVDRAGNVACAPASTLAVGVGDRCDTEHPCGPAQHCIAGECRRLCNPTDCGLPACPPEEGVCVHLNRNPPGVGECTPGFEQLARDNP